jgi:chromate transporter
MIGTLVELFLAYGKIGFLAFGGGNAAIPLLGAVAVPRWMSQQEFGERVGLRAAGPPRLLVAVIGLASAGLVLTIGAYSLLLTYRDHSLVRRSLVAMQYAAAALMANSALRMVQVASGGQWQSVGVVLRLPGAADASCSIMG